MSSYDSRQRIAVGPPLPLVGRGGGEPQPPGLDITPTPNPSQQGGGGKHALSLPNDPYGWIDGAAADLHKAARELVANGEASRVSDEALAQIITAAVRLYYAKSEGEDRPVPAIVQEGDDTITPTEMLVTVSEMLRDVRLGPMELGLWFRRRPGEN